MLPVLMWSSTVWGKRMAADLPAPVEQVIDAVNAGDTEGFLDAFSGVGVVDDWGRVATGRDQIRHWSDREFVGANASLTPEAVTRGHGEVTVDGSWTSSHFSGPSRFVFWYDDAGVTKMVIAAH